MKTEVIQSETSCRLPAAWIPCPIQQPAYTSSEVGEGERLLDERRVAAQQAAPHDVLSRVARHEEDRECRDRTRAAASARALALRPGITTSDRIRSTGGTATLDDRQCRLARSASNTE